MLAGYLKRARCGIRLARDPPEDPNRPGWQDQASVTATGVGVSPRLIGCSPHDRLALATLVQRRARYLCLRPRPAPRQLFGAQTGRSRPGCGQAAAQCRAAALREGDRPGQRADRRTSGPGWIASGCGDGRLLPDRSRNVGCDAHFSRRIHRFDAATEG